MVRGVKLCHLCLLYIYTILVQNSITEIGGEVIMLNRKWQDNNKI